jgi:hypothetical protein
MKNDFDSTKCLASIFSTRVCIGVNLDDTSATKPIRLTLSTARPGSFPLLPLVKIKSELLTLSRERVLDER